MSEPGRILKGAPIDLDQLHDTIAHERVLAAQAREIARLREALGIIAECPPEAVHLMPLAAQAALSGKEAQ